MGAGLPGVTRYRTWIAVAVLCVVFLLSQRMGLAARQTETCEAVNEVKAALVTYVDQQLNRAAKSLPTIDYYHRHPVELGRQLAALERQRQSTHEAFAPTSC